MRYKIFLDASCLLAALGSSRGGSNKLLMLVSESNHKLYTSEISIEESKRHLGKIGSTNKKLVLLVRKFGIIVLNSPEREEVEKCYKYVKDKDDAYLIASCFMCDSHYLVSLDKKHVLAIAPRLKKPKILSPGQMIKELD